MTTATLATLPGAAVAAATARTFHGAVTEFKRRLIEATLWQEQGNRTRAARVLGLQRTYLLREAPSDGLLTVSFHGVANAA